jgi:hypothetical protein
MPDAKCARSLACKIKKHTSIVTTVTPGIVRHSLRDGFTDSFVLFPATGFLATVVGGSLRQLDASIGASEPHDFPVREQRVRLSRRLASIASCPASVTIASRPCEEQDAHIRKVFRFR